MPIKKCQICGNEFYVKTSHLQKGWGKFCSIACRIKGQYKGKYFKCHICGKIIYRSPKLISRSKSQNFFCSKSCQTLWRNTEFNEERNKNWKNGIRTYRNILKRSGREPICHICKNNDNRILIVHHIDHNRSHNQPDNLSWLCLNCHFLIHHDKKLEKQIYNI